MSQTARQHRLLKSAMGEPYFPPTPRGYHRDREGKLVHPWQEHDPLAGTEPSDFSLDRVSAEHLASLSPERRAELNGEWE